MRKLIPVVVQKRYARLRRKLRQGAATTMRGCARRLNARAAHMAERSTRRSSLRYPASMAESIRHFANPGDAFEARLDDAPREFQRLARTIAFYLPQFHAFEENNRWWGEGFTEWRNVSRGAPRFRGHYQPRIPRDLGCYDLDNPEVIRAQCELAADAGIEAFCFYYYWFDGKRLMDKPLDAFCEMDVEQDFCIMWANENWTRTWDGFDSEVLIEQHYRDEDEAAFIADTARYMAHERYVKVAGRPLFLLYRPGLLPDARNTLSRWRERWTEALGMEPWILMVQGFGDTDPRVYGLDGAVEFPPHKLCENLPNINRELEIFDERFTGNVRDYEAVVATSLNEAPPAWPLVKTVVPHWDNDARREGRGLTLHGSTPENYERWLKGAIDYANRHPFAGESLVFINAWNEWAEGAYLEPDVHYGHAYLNATRRAVSGMVSPAKSTRILLVGHDAYRHGAQMLLLNIATVFRRQFGMEVTILLKGGGPLLQAYRAVARTEVLETLLARGGEAALDAFLAEHRDGMAICNTTVTGDLVPRLKRQGLSVVSLVHEMPALVREYALEKEVAAINGSADHVVFASSVVQDGFNGFCDADAIAHARQLIRPQGSYKAIAWNSEARQRIRRELGIGDDARVIVNVGYADLRKGFDLFMQSAIRLTQAHPDLHFIWAGALAPDMERWLASDLEACDRERIHLVGFTDAMSDYYSASDCLFLSSREDPYPSVVLEAMDVGLPVVLFRGATGFESMIDEFGTRVERTDTEALDRALLAAIDGDSDEAAAHRMHHVRERARFDDYCFDLLKLLVPDMPKISVVVPNYNYAHYMSGRLGSVFAQQQPVFEVLVLDDASSDDSVAEIRRIAAGAERHVRLVVNDENSGNVFRQWRKGLSLARGELVWIAEADDLAAPDFLTASAAGFASGTVMSFTDSAQIDAGGRHLADSYDYYYPSIDAALFAADFDLPGREFVARALSVRNGILNASAVLWRRETLVASIMRLADELAEARLVGDWLLYLDVLAGDGARISYLNRSLNTHRRHDRSVTGSLDHERHLDEIMSMHERALVLFGEDISDAGKRADYVAELRRQFGLDAEAGAVRVSEQDDAANDAYAANGGGAEGRDRAA
ncbi:MAG: lipopolysaccharide biosynthesis protein [Gammaproteobacteria bacterium]|nr:MAG: lipopolysaccharide biosynthesis protein [Gammaproteobacteria bacterium]